MQKLLKIAILLCIIANFEWMFILSNYSQLKELESLQYSNAQNREEEILKKMNINCKNRCIDTPNINIDNNSGLATNGFIKANNDVYTFIPTELIIPSLNKNISVITTNNNIEEALNRGVLNFYAKDKDNNDKKGIFIFGHSSAPVKSKFQYVFTKITKLNKNNFVILENSNETRLYSFVKSYIKFPSELSDINSSDNELFLITCYPFLTTYQRYIVELRLIKIIKK